MTEPLAPHLNPYPAWPTGANLECWMIQPVDVAAVIAGYVDGTAPVYASSVTAAWPALPSELAARGVTLTEPTSIEAVRDQPWGITSAVGAIVETGSVILNEPDLFDRSVSLMTQSLIVICDARTVRPSLTDAAEIMRAASQPGPSFLTLLSGPSRTADIERALAIGVQGPGGLIILMVDQS